MTYGLAAAEEVLGWPTSDMIFDPPGAGPAVIADLAVEKIQQHVRRLSGGAGARVGVLVLDPTSPLTQAPLALVCEFPSPAPISTLHALHCLAWNFSRAPLLVTSEPHRLRAFSCCEVPRGVAEGSSVLEAEIPSAMVDWSSLSVKAAAASALHWLNLISGLLQKEFPERFNRDFAADSLLLSNLEVVRGKLQNDHEGLNIDIVHDLLARLIFIQFLFHRKDPSGRAAIDSDRLAALRNDKILVGDYFDLEGILSSHEDTYRLFQYLNEKFNGDLFPGKNGTIADRNKEWRREMDAVKPEHLALLRSLVSGSLDIRNGQPSLWPLYSFDTLPLEFISSIYEVFVEKGNSTVYTPVHLVDFILDSVLPWEGAEWNLTVLDPACGSGVFLVRAFQRLIHRWKRAHGTKEVPPELLKNLLENNLVGIDIDPHAVRVASFGLYLAMCDEISPRDCWDRLRFPLLRGVRLHASDFFSDDIPGLSPDGNAGFDLVVGNPPWGKNSISENRKRFESTAPLGWAKSHGWPISYGDIGPLFIAKAALLTKPEGRISLLQPAQTLLINESPKAPLLRRKIFKELLVEEITNFSLIRSELFGKKAISPCVQITLRPIVPESDYFIAYTAIKPGDRVDSKYRFSIYPTDVNEVSAFEAVENPRIWTTFTWGGPRDHRLMERLGGFDSVNTLVKRGAIVKRRGIIRGNSKKREQKDLVGLKLFASRQIPDEHIFWLNTEYLERNLDGFVHYKDSTNLAAFQSPQLIVKLGWQHGVSRFRAVRPIGQEAVLCSDSYVSLHARAGEDYLLDEILVGVNSKIGSYFLFMGASRFTYYREAVDLKDVLSIPLPRKPIGSLNAICTYESLDLLARNSYGLDEVEWALVEDALAYSLPFAKGGKNSIHTRSATPRGSNVEGAACGTRLYCEWFIRLLQSSFGANSNISATIFEEKGLNYLSTRIVAIHLDSLLSGEIRTDFLLPGDGLTNQLKRLSSFSGDGNRANQAPFKRIAMTFQTILIDGRESPTIFIAKPDEARFWTRSNAVRDADQVVLEVVNWQSGRGGNDA